MKIIIEGAAGTSSLVYALENWCAKQVHAAVIEQHSISLAKEDGVPLPYPPIFLPMLAEVRAVVQAFQDPWERRMFLMGVRRAFRGLLREHGTDPTTQQYIKRVKNNRAMAAA